MSVTRVGRVLLAIAFVSSLLASAPPRAGAEEAGPPEYAPGEILVKLRPGVDSAALADVAVQVKGTILRKYKLLTLARLRLQNPDGLQEALQRLTGLPAVEFAEPNYYRHLNATPDDPWFSELWGLNNSGQSGGTPDADIDAADAWDLTTGNPNMVVADIDSGADLSHQDLAPNIWTNPGEIPGNGIDDDGNGYIDDVHGWDFAHDDNDPSDTDAACGGHGSHTAGTIGAAGNNGMGVTGVNWNVKIMPLKVFRKVFVVGCTASSADIIAAIEYATTMGVRVSNNSYGSTQFSQAEYAAIRASKSVFVAAAGNDGHNNDVTPSYPANYDLPNVISVAATDRWDAIASFSNFGSSVDLGAPGVSILSTTPGNTYSTYDGTSMATPHVTGAVALVMGNDPSLTNNEVRFQILNGTDPKELPVRTGGRLNVYKALTFPAPNVTVDVAATGPVSVRPGGTIQYSVTLHNAGAASATVKASVVAVLADGRERSLLQKTLTVPAGATVGQSFSQPVPLSTPSGSIDLAARVEVPSVGYDEDVEVFQIL